MADLLPLVLALPIAVGIALSFLVERGVEPRPCVFWKRSASELALHMGIWISMFVFELLVFRRPWFAMFAVLTLQLIVVLVSNAKLHSLREPFVFQDFDYFIDALKHPRFFLPFLGLWRGLCAVGAFLAVLMLGMTAEPAMDFPAVAAGGIPLGISGAGLLLWGSSRKCQLTFEPCTDIRSMGFWACLWRYAAAEKACPTIASPLADLLPSALSLDRMPHIIAVQSESFFDARRHYPLIRPDVLQHYDQLKHTSDICGCLHVPAWGANTVRTEFAFFSGLSDDLLGVHRFNPYRKLARCGIPTLVGYLKGLGYRTICVHPYPASYYGRDERYPEFGFDEFVDLKSFDPSGKVGPYIGDAAVAEKVCSLLGGGSDRPLFIFVITMENHGPLHLEPITPEDEADVYTTTPPKGCHELTAYLRHLKNADRMAAIIRGDLETLARPALLCWYGDHVPVMPTAYATLGMPDGTTDYLLWRTDDGSGLRPPFSVRQRDLPVSALARLLLLGSGLAVEAAPGSARGGIFPRNRT